MVLFTDSFGWWMRKWMILVSSVNSLHVKIIHMYVNFHYEEYELWGYLFDASVR